MKAEQGRRLFKQNFFAALLSIRYSQQMDFFTIQINRYLSPKVSAVLHLPQADFIYLFLSKDGTFLQAKKYFLSLTASQKASEQKKFAFARNSYMTEYTFSEFISFQHKPTNFFFPELYVCNGTICFLFVLLSSVVIYIFSCCSKCIRLYEYKVIKNLLLATFI